MSPSALKVSIIGAGSVGSAISCALFEKGYSIVSIISKSAKPAIQIAKSVKCRKVSTQVTDIPTESDIIILTVPDDVIGKTVASLVKFKKIKFNKLFIFHCSGVHSTEILEPLRKKGALVASIHPIQTFPKYQRGMKISSRLRNIYFGIEGRKEAIQKAENIVRDLSGKSIVVPKELKPLYHIACVFASSYMAAFLNTISEIAKKVCLKASWTDLFGPLMTTTMENTIKMSAPLALTGPIIRKDAATLDLHLTTLLRHAPQFIPLYTVGGIEIARIAKDNGIITQDDFSELISKFKEFVRKNSLKKISKVKS